MNHINKAGNETELSERWGVLRDISPSFGARLVQERYRLHFLSDRSDFVGEWSEQERRALEGIFPTVIKELEGALLSGDLDSSRQKRICIEHDWLICEADSLGSFGYVYLSIYPDGAKK